MKMGLVTSCITMVTLAVALPSLANQVVEKPLKERIAQSDAIVVGECVNTFDRATEMIMRQFATMKVRVVIKGKVESQILVRVNDGIAENNVKCCTIGHGYLMFLTRDNGGYFNLVNTRFGIYDIEKR